MAEKKTIITIGRQFGSGGHEIGATIAQDLGINLYDKEMLKRAYATTLFFLQNGTGRKTTN